jgi:hypothetical protein
VNASPLRSRLTFFRFSLGLCVALGITITTDCGSSGIMSNSKPALSGNTSVTLLLSSTANGRLDQFDLGFNSVTLTSQSGKTVNLFTAPQNAAPQNAEFIHLNGSFEPFLTVSVPQDVYTAATANIAPAFFTCDALDPSGSLNTATYNYGYVPAGQVTVNVGTPITITGAAMGLSLNLLVSQSASFPSTCYTTGIEPFSITPTLDLTPVAFSTPVAENLLDGQISSINAAGSSFTLVLADGQTLSVNTNSGTVYQGITGFSLLADGALIDMDAAIQADGSQLATRIAVEDTNTTNLSASTGPLLQIAGSQPTLFGFERQHQGYLTTSRQAANLLPYNFSDVIFQISGKLTNLQDLPFVAAFDAADMFPGQNVYVTSHATTISGGPTYVPATTITLVPQVINGTITAVANDGAFATYAVTLAPYDLIPDLAVQAGQTTVLSDPSTAIVYVDGNTQQLNTQPLAVGGVFRFNGLLFNDNGALRMDCSQVKDGVAE